MKVVIAGSREITDFSLVSEAIEESGFTITEVVSGAARGVDRLGERWAGERGIPIKRFPADWDNIDAPNARIKRWESGKCYNANAGHERNKQMAEYAEGLVAVWDGKSPGTESMIKLARKNKLEIYVKRI